MQKNKKVVTWKFSEVSYSEKYIVYICGSFQAFFILVIHFGTKETSTRWIHGLSGHSVNQTPITSIVTEGLWWHFGSFHINIHLDFVSNSPWSLRIFLFIESMLAE